MVSRRTMRGALEAVKNLDFAPQVVFDVGAQTGTKPLYEAFPDAKHVMFEPVEEHEERLKRVCESLSDATYSIAAVGQDSGTTGLSLTKDLNHSGMVSDMDDYDPVTHIYRTVPKISLNDFVKEKALEGPYLIKVDVDGLELDVLRGATELFAQTEYLIVEATIYDRIYKIMDFLVSYDLVLYDIFDPLYREYDDALWQVDLAFVKKKGNFRSYKGYK